jgi:hypothetical protein
MHRYALILLLLSVAGCNTEAAGSFAAANAASIPVFHRSIPDLAVSAVTGRDCSVAVTGRDCSVVRLDQGKTYCRETEPPPDRPPFCTRSLGMVDCWVNPEALNGGPPREVADGPRTLTPEQEKDRTRRWPGL